MAVSLPLPELRLATANAHKVAELRELLGDRYDIRARPDDLAETVEDGETLEANAFKKAREVAEHSGAPALADDTGLFVDALDGRPGIYSARYAGPDAGYRDNVDKLLAELAPFEDPEARSATFRTVIAVVWPDGRRLTLEGAVAGRIGSEPRGGNGFGYDPVFLPDEAGGLTFAEMDAAAKNGISHRGRAVAALVETL